MEHRDPNDVSLAEISPKTKQKKKSLCRLLMNKKTRVGCLEVPYRDGESNKSGKIHENSHHGSHTSTKLSLCCAMTERSRTPPQSLTVSRLSPTTGSCVSGKSELGSSNGNCRHEVAVEKEKGMSPLLRRQYCSDCSERQGNSAGAREPCRTAVCNEGENRFVIFINFIARL